MGAASSKPVGDSHARIVEVLKKVPFMQMMDAKIIDEIAACFQLVTYPKGAVIKSDPWLFFIVAEGAVDISSLIPTANRKQNVHEVLCQRRVGDYISFAAREQLLTRLMEESFNPNGKEGRGGSNQRMASKNLIAMLDLNRITADVFTGCTVLKLHRDRFLKLRVRLESRKSQGRGDINHTRRFDDEEDASGSTSKPLMKRRSTITMTRPEKIHLLNSVVESDIVNYLFDIPFLEGVEQSRLVTLSNLCAYTFIRKGEVLCHEGEIGDRFFICIRGNLQATIQSVAPHSTHDVESGIAHAPSIKRLHPERKIQALKRMGSGAYFGEISLLFRIPRICSITAIDDSLLVYIDRVAFCNFLKIVPEASLILLEHVRLNFMDTLIKQGCAFLGAIPQLKRQELSYVSELKEYDVGEQIITRGERKTAFYIVLRGEVEVEYFPLHSRATVAERVTTLATDRSDSEEDADSVIMPISPRREVIRVRPGEYFGHEAIILGVASPISAKCVDHALLLRLTPDRFFQFFASTPASYAEFCIKCLREKSRPEHIMQHYEAHKLWAADCVNRRRQNELTLFESIEDFTWEAEIAEERLHELAVMVYMRFLADNAPLRVNIASHTLERIEDELSSQQVTANVFDATRAEILTRLEDEHFEHFKQTPMFQEFLASLHCPQTIYDGLTTNFMARLGMGSQPREGDARPNLELEDVDENNDISSFVMSQKMGSRSGASGKSFGRGGGSQSRYAVASTDGGGRQSEFSQQQATALAVSVASRRSSRIDVGVQRNLSTSFVF